MKLNPVFLDFKKGTKKDIKSLESIRLKSIENCNQYTVEQLNVWRNSQLDWNNLIKQTTICYYNKKLVGFVSIRDNELHSLYVDPSFQNQGIGNKLVSLVETKGMCCDTNSNSEKVLIKRGWEFSSKNIKTVSGQTFYNKWYRFDKKNA